MKKIFVYAFLLFACYSASAQSGTITIVNHTDYQVNVWVHAQATTYCSGGGCDAYISNLIYLPSPSSPAYPAGTVTYGPVDFCGIRTGVGWATETCTGIMCSSIPADFQWTYAEVEVLGSNVCFPLLVSLVSNVGDNTIACAGASTPLSFPSTGLGCGASYTIDMKWSPDPGSPMDDITLTIDQY